MYCGNCGREIDDRAVICPHCGVPVGNMQVQPTKQGNTIAIVGFILSFFVALAGLICCILGYNKAVKEGAPYKGLALAGIIISILSMVLAFFIYRSMLAYL